MLEHLDRGGLDGVERPDDVDVHHSLHHVGGVLDRGAFVLD